LNSMPLKAFSLKKDIVEPTRYHIKHSDSLVTVVSADDKKLKKKMKNAVDTELCTKERCLLCHTYHMALMPTIQPGQILLFTSGDYDTYSMECAIMVTKPFNPYSAEVNEPADIIRLGYGEKIDIMEIWREDDKWEV